MEQLILDEMVMDVPNACATNLRVVKLDEKQGDMFVFPKGLVHFQYNSAAKTPVLAISAFGSASAGTVSVPTAIFNTSISDNILAKSFKTDVATIHKIKLGLGFKD
ncbi:hypothetical protein RJ639_035102 [Escallonia herrerae]|uniref:Germin-like protein n=1 Tax=Escallonia herrerae TaxID=1293975 RepID=A0AA88WNA9_9ASTE|nr:hypothetical protein RJ639_035102 [Escallonia herrerae]